MTAPSYLNNKPFRKAFVITNTTINIITSILIIITIIVK